MTNRKTILRTSLAAFLALGTVAGATAPAAANGFSFSWSTPHGTFTIGPNGHFEHNRWRPHHAQPERQQIRRREARRTLRRAGFRDISFIRERNQVYVFEARGRHGYRRIAVNKFNGNIIWRWGRG